VYPMLPVSLFLMPLWYSLTVISFIGQSQCHVTFTQQRHLVFAINIPEIQLIVHFFWMLNNDS
jgi:hypothetical protein